jgi:hypothetical protein
MRGRGKRPGKKISLLVCAVFFVFSCENPMVQHLLREKPGEDDAPLALYGGVWYYSLKEAVDMAVLAALGTASSPDSIYLRRNIRSARALGNGITGMSIPAGTHISLRPYTKDVSSAEIHRWKGNNGTLFVVEPDASLTLEEITIDGKGIAGRAVYVCRDDDGAGPRADGELALKGASRITTDNDVYLECGPAPSSDGAKIRVDGALGTNPAARITPETYPAPPPPFPPFPASNSYSLMVLAGTGPNISANHNQFDVTPESVSGWESPRQWRVDAYGYLIHVVARSFDGYYMNYYQDLQAAFTDAITTKANPRTITLMSNIDFGSGYQIGVGTVRYIIFTVDPGYRYILKRTASSSLSMINMGTMCSLEIAAPAGSALILDGGADWGGGSPAAGAANIGGIQSTAPLIAVTDTVSTPVSLLGKLTLGEGAVLRNNDRQDTGAKNGGAVEITGAEFIMNGGLITHNRVGSASYVGNGGGIYIGRNENVIRWINGGVISDNDASCSGGGIMFALDGGVKLYMAGGSILNNRAGGPAEATRVSIELTGWGGGVFIPGYASDGTNAWRNELIMTGGLVSGNRSINGGGWGNGVVVDLMNVPGPLLSLGGSARIDSATNNDIMLHNNNNDGNILKRDQNYITAAQVAAPILLTLDTYTPLPVKVLSDSTDHTRFSNPLGHSIQADRKLH